MSDPLRPFWDFDDLDATEARFRALRAEALTQLARVEGLRDGFAGGDRLLDEVVDDARVSAFASTWSAAGFAARLATRRLRCRSSSARSRAVDAGEDWLAGDAAHMGALAAPDRDGFIAWTTVGSSWRSRSPAAVYWVGPLLNNLGWEYFDAGEYEQALDAFERALEMRVRDPGNPAAIEHAREAVAEARKALGRQTGCLSRSGPFRGLALSASVCAC